MARQVDVQRFMAGELEWQTLVAITDPSDEEYVPVDVDDHISWAEKTLKELKIAETRCPGLVAWIEWIEERVTAFAIHCQHVLNAGSDSSRLPGSGAEGALLCMDPSWWGRPRLCDLRTGGLSGDVEEEGIRGGQDAAPEARVF